MGYSFLRLSSTKSVLRIALGYPFQLVCLNALAIFALPSAIFTSQNQIIFTFIPERGSLFVAISVLLFLAKVQAGRMEWIWAPPFAFFFRLYIWRRHKTERHRR